MRLVNITTGIVEYNGPRANFPGIEAFQHAEVDTEFEMVLSADEQRDLIREQITAKAGDTASLLGTASDAAQFLLYCFTGLIAKLNTANSLAEVRAAAAPFAELASGFLAKVESGEVKLPFQAKGVERVVSDIEQRATSVAEVLEANTNLHSNSRRVRPAHHPALGIRTEITNNHHLAEKNKQ